MYDDLSTFCLIPSVETVDRLVAQLREAQGRASTRRLADLLLDYPRDILECRDVLIFGPPSDQERQRLRELHDHAGNPCQALHSDREGKAEDLFERVCHWDYEARTFTVLACNLAAILEFLGEPESWSAIATVPDESLQIEIDFRRLWLQRLKDDEPRLGDEDFTHLACFRVPDRVLTGNIRKHFVELMQLREARHLLLGTAGVQYLLPAEDLLKRSGSEPWDAVLIDPGTQQCIYLEFTEVNPPRKQGARSWGDQRHREDLVVRKTRRLVEDIQAVGKLGYTITLKSGPLPADKELDAVCAGLRIHLLRGHLPPTMPAWIAGIEPSPAHGIEWHGEEWTCERGAFRRPTPEAVLDALRRKAFRKSGAPREPLPGAGFLLVRLNPTDSSKKDFEAVGQGARSQIGPDLAGALVRRGFGSAWLASERSAIELWAARKSGAAATGGNRG